MSLKDIPLWLDLLLTALIVIGAFFALVGSWGLVKLSDFLKRLHGPTKATTLGVGCVLIASSIWFSVGQQTLSLHEFLITLFLFLTAPVSAHLLVKAALYMDDSIRPPPPGGKPVTGTSKNQPGASQGTR
jgi:multicomponent K+:H+ antiporter subunit G